jgi:hypothetical protein
VVPISNPVIELINSPVPRLSNVLFSEMVGFADTLQHMPRAITFAPPSLLMFPPLLQEVAVIDEILVVIKIGRVGLSFLHEEIKKIDKNNRVNLEILKNFFMWDHIFLTFSKYVPCQIYSLFK